MQNKSTDFNNKNVGPSEYTVNFVLNFSKSLKIIKVKSMNRILVCCN